MKAINKTLGALALALSLYSCGSVPITGRRSLNMVSDEQLLSESRQQYSSFVAKARSQGEIVQDPRILGITNRLIQATQSYLANNNHNDLWHQMQWELNVVKSDDINAFCMPGGKIVVYTGLAKMLGLGKGSDDELAAVIGHEIAHAIARHANERVSRAQLQSMGGQILSSVLGSGSMGQGALGLLVENLYGIGTQAAISLPFNRKQELEADKMGMVLMAIAGYNPEYAVSLWQKMEKSSGGKSNSFWSTHPSEAKRIQEIQAYMPTAMQYYKAPAPVQKGSTPTPTTNTKRNSKTVHIK